jgi:tetratricopeptide (TPR) repeat protein
MTEPEVSQPVPENDIASATATEETLAPESESEAAPPPEPWTPERVSEWNAYYDFYVKSAVLLLVFITSCNYAKDSQLWLHLKTGQMITEQGSPVTTDVFSYTANGQSWTDLPWLFQVSHAALYKLILGLVPVNPTDPTANRESAEQIAIGTLVVLSALARLATAGLLLKLRHRGPGLWWSAIVVAVAMGVVYHPGYGYVLGSAGFGIMMGGIAGPGFVAPSTWGLLLFALEMYVLFRAFTMGRGGALWLLIPTFLVWANVDESFLTGLLVLAAAVVGRLFDGSNAAALISRPEESETAAAGAKGELEKKPSPPRAAIGFIVLALSAAVCLLNPFTYRVYQAAIYPYMQLLEPTSKVTTADLLSFFGPWLRTHGGSEWYWLPTFYLAVVALGLGSFLLNANRFSWSRFLPFALLSVIWGTFMHANPLFSVVFAAVVGVNGQEWYLDRFGTEGRLGGLWRTWSTGGRLVMLGLVFFMIFNAITGRANTALDVRFGLGFNPDDFSLEAATFLENHPEIKGNILNTSMQQGNMLIWKNAPQRKSYIDGRTRLFSRELMEQWEKTRKALSEDEVETWKPLLDQYQISAVMIETKASPLTYRTLMQSPNWIPFYDDGQIVMFGRADAPGSDLAFFKINRLDPELRAYRTTHPIRGAERPPNATTWIDDVFQNRTYARLQARNDSARRWLDLGDASDPTYSANDPPLPDPARCLMAIQDARTSLARSPDDWVAYRVLNEAYRYLMFQEGAMLAGIPIKPEYRSRIRSNSPSLEHLMGRFQQRVTVLNFAIQTTPPPRDLASRRELHTLNLDLAQLYMNANALDLARNRLQAVIDTSQTDDFPPDGRMQIQRQLDQLNQQMKLLEDKLADLEIERQAGPVEQAQFALSQGGAGKAIDLLADAERNNVQPAVVKPRLIDLYCNTGQPDKALELLAVGAIDDPNLGSEPGSGALRQGRVYHLLGNYLSAVSLWKDRAIPRVRYDRSTRVLGASSALTHGEAVQATNLFLALPSTLNQQASWEFDLAMCNLEAGMPEDAATHFTQALTLAPDLGVRTIATYYLEKLGKPVPPGKRSATTAVADATATKAPGSLITPVPLLTGQPVPLAGSPTAPAEVQSPAPKEVAKTPNPAPAPAAGKEPAPK